MARRRREKGNKVRKFQPWSEPEKGTVERVDGREYTVGTREHDEAIATKVRNMRARIDASEMLLRFDANATAFLARDLVHVQQENQRVFYQALQMGSLVPIKSVTPIGAETVAIRTLDRVGEAKFTSELAGDGPRVDVMASEDTYPVRELGASYHYTVRELEKAAHANIPLDREKSDAAAEVLARKIDQLIAFGDTGSNQKGFFNNPNVGVLTLTAGKWTTTGTVATIQSDIAQLETQFITNGQGWNEQSTLLLQTPVEGVLVRTTTGSNADCTLKSFFLRPGNTRSINSITRVPLLDTAAAPKVVTANEGVLYTPDPSCVYVDVPLPYEELPPQAKGFEWVVNCRSLFAGVQFLRPWTALYVANLV